MAAAGTQGTVTKSKTGFFTTEASITLAGGQTNIPILTEGLPFASVQMQQPSGTNITSIQQQGSNDGVNFTNMGAAILFANIPQLTDLWAAAGVPVKFVQFVVNGGDATSVVQINITFMGTRG